MPLNNKSQAALDNYSLVVLYFTHAAKNSGIRRVVAQMVRAHMNLFIQMQQV